MRINAEIQQPGDSRYTVSGDRQHFHSLRIVHLRELRTRYTAFGQKSVQQVFVEKIYRCTLNNALIIVHMVAVCLKTVDFVIGHMAVSIAYTHIRTVLNSSTDVVTRTLSVGNGRNLCRTDPHAFVFGSGKQSTNRRLHLIALLGYFFLQILQIIHADCCEMFVFIQSKQENTAAVLVGKAGKRITQFAWTPAMCGLHFNGLRLGLLCLHTFCKFNQIFHLHFENHHLYLYYTPNYQNVNLNFENMFDDF